MGMNQPGGSGPQVGGLVGMLMAIPQIVQGLKIQKQQQQLQTMMAGQQQLDYLRNIIKGDPSQAQNPDIIAAITKIGKDTGNLIPMQQAPQGTAQQGPQGAGPGMTLPKQPAGRQTQQPTGPQLDVNAFLGSNPVTEFIQKHLADIQATRTPEGREAEVQAGTGTTLTPEQKKQVDDIQYQLPAAQQETERKAIDTIVSKRLDEAAKTGTASALTAAVKFNYRRFEEAGYSDDEINALLDPALDKMSPVELQKIADGKATAGLKDAQAAFLRDSAKAKVDLIYQQADDDKARAAELRAQADSVRTLTGPRAGLIAAQTKEALAKAATAGGINDSVVRRNNAEATWYAQRAADLKTQGDPHAVTQALSSVRAAKASTDAGVRAIDSTIARITTSLTSMSPTVQAQNQPYLEQLKKQKQMLQDRSNQYDSAITTLTNKVAPGVLAAPSAGSASTSGNAPTAPAAPASAQPPAGSQRVQNPATGQYGWRYPDGTIHPDTQ